MTDSAAYPTVRLKPKADARALRHGFPWAYDDDVVLDRRTRNLAPGAIVRVEDGQRAPVATCAFNPGSKLALRRLDSDIDAIIDATWLQSKVAAAVALRSRLFDQPFYRLVHAEGDGLPGLVIDRFGAALVIQPNAAWIDALLDDLISVLEGALAPEVIVINGTGRGRKSEGLPEITRVVKGTLDGPLPVTMNGATYMADLIGGQKTGLFFDQRDNHAFAARLADDKSRVLDVFSHVGGFGLAALASGAGEVSCVDASQAALDLALQGAAARGFDARLSTMRGDAFEQMAGLAQQGRQFDLVVCDPPAFAPNKQALAKGLRAYERVAKLAAPLVAPGGFLGLCSCSHAADVTKFGNSSMRGIGRAGRTGQLIYTGFAGPDHPMVPQLGENGYLKALFYRLD